MATKKKAVVHRCGKCNRKLKEGRWIYSRFTGNRYCWPGEGCEKS
jgi:hypothetical protein